MCQYSRIKERCVPLSTESISELAGLKFGFKQKQVSDDMELSARGIVELRSPYTSYFDLDTSSKCWCSAGLLAKA